jgi:HK97 family phage portal protein
MYPISGRMPAIVEPSIGELRSLENPSTPLSAPDDWLYDALGSWRASSGVNVNAQTALSYAAWWRGVNLLARDVGRLPLHLCRRVGPGRERHTRHRVYRMLRYKPNSEMTARVLREMMTAHVVAQGNAYSYISRDGTGRPLELIPLNPTQVYPVRANGKLWYVLDIPTVAMRKEEPRNIFHLKGLSYDGLLGYSVIAKARESLGLGMAMQTYGSIFFRNNAQPRVVLVYPNTLKPETRQNLRENWERMHAGLENAHRTAILDGGPDIKTITINARDAQLIEGRQFEIREVANWLHVPPHKLGDTSRTSFSSLEQENQQYLDEGLAPWLNAWEEEIWDKLLTEDEQEELFAEFDVRGLLRANLAARGPYYQLAVNGGWMTPNQVREEEGMNPREDPDGDKYAQNTSNMTWVGGPAVDDDEDDSPAAAQGEAGTELLDLPDIRQQDDYSCGAAAAMAVGQYFGVGPDTLEEWKAALSTTEQKSTRPFAIVQYLTELGLVVTAGGDLTIEDLKACWRAGQPVICPIQEYGIPSKQASFLYGHYVVVIGAALGHIFVADSSIDNVLEGQDSDQAPGRSLISEEDWLRVWHDQDIDGKQYIRFGIAVGKELPKEPEPAPPETPPAAPPAKPAGPAKPAPARDRLLEVHRRLIEDATRRMCKRIGIQARKAAKDADKFSSWLAGLETDNRAVMMEAMGPAIEAALLVIGAERSTGDLVDVLLATLRDELEARAAAPAGGLEESVDRLMGDYESYMPSSFAASILSGVEEIRAKPDKPDRTTEQALDILDRLPPIGEDPDTVTLTMPVNENPPYKGRVSLDDLRDLPTKVVKIRQLVGTRATLKRKRVADFVRNPDAYTKGREMQDLPSDRPYVIRCDKVDYIYDGHHRLMARQLLATVKTEVYFYDEDKE